MTGVWLIVGGVVWAILVFKLPINLLFGLIGAVSVIVGTFLLVAGLNRRDRGINSHTQVHTGRKEVNTFGLIAFILSFFTPLFGIIGAMAGISALVFSIIGIIQISKNPQKYKARWMTWMSIIIVITCIVLLIIF